MPATYSIVEPHPSTTKAIHTSRGGAGNVVRLDSTTTTPGQSACGPASLTRLDSHQRKYYTSGRGGAGNVHASNEHAIFSFDEELELQLRHDQHAAPVFHIGRGGAGNAIAADGTSLARRSSSSTVASNDSAVLSNSSRKSVGARLGRIVGIRS
jgi:hypothetical protein